MNLKNKIRNISDFPQKGIIFRDIAPLLEDPVSFRYLVDSLSQKFSSEKIAKVVGIDARGFLFASALAYKLGAGLVMIRKQGKLPYKTASVAYQLEYGQASLEIHEDSIRPGENVLLVDDVLATGGTMQAAASLVEKTGGKIVGLAFLISLDYLPGREKLKKYPLFSLIQFSQDE